MSFHPALMLLAALIEAAVGYPSALFRALGHPVSWAGRLIARLDDRLNRATLPEARRRLNGVLALAALLLAAGLAAALAAGLLRAALPRPAALALTAVLASSLLAQRSLYAHVEAVRRALDESGLAAGRAAVANIVGRDPASLDAAAVARAAIESLAENFADGVVAPLFWGVVLGLPGAALYKAANTADSMIGHRTARHAAFGWASARFDDWVNLPASRLAALWLVGAAALVGADWRGACRAVFFDARRHRSPNAGWPEAAMAGALGLALAGPRRYAGVLVEDAFMGGGRAAAGAGDIARALAIYRAACALQIVVLAALAAALAALA